MTWPPGTVAVLVTGGRAIPVSTAQRLSDGRVAFGLGPERGSLARLRADPACALCVMAEGMASTLYGTAREAGEVEGVVALVMEVESEVDHGSERFVIERGVAWRWTDEAAAERDAAVRDGLSRLG